jgi:hypothetical protein
VCVQTYINRPEEKEERSTLSVFFHPRIKNKKKEKEKSWTREKKKNKTTRINPHWKG